METNKQITNDELLQLLKGAYQQIRALKSKNSQLLGELIQTTVEFNRSEQRVAELEEIAGRDELSGLLNRRALNEKKYLDPREIIAMIDLDDFKSINDRYLHKTGDDIIANVGAIILDTVYPVDLAFRYGGDEFVVIFIDCPYEKALERLQIISQRYNNMCNDLIDTNHTLSFGVYCSDQTLPIIEALDKADEQMYRDKRMKKLKKGIYRGIRRKRQ